VIGSGPKEHVDLTSRRIVPGPGTYQELSRLSKSGISFGKSMRNGFDGNDQPGPGAYKVPVKFANVPKYLIPVQDE